MAPPDGTDDENQRPEEKNDSVKAGSAAACRKVRAIAFEDSRADERSETFVGKNHRRTQANIRLAGRNAPDLVGPESFRLKKRPHRPPVSPVRDAFQEADG